PQRAAFRKVLSWRTRRAGKRAKVARRRELGRQGWVAVPGRRSPSALLGGQLGETTMAMDMFIRIGTLQGESRDKVHGAAGKQKIDVLAWSWGMSNSGTAHTGGGAGAGKANVQDLSITKYIDKCSPSLMLACCKGTHYDDAELIVRKAGDTPVEYVKI